MLRKSLTVAKSTPNGPRTIGSYVEHLTQAQARHLRQQILDLPILRMKGVNNHSVILDAYLTRVGLTLDKRFIDLIVGDEDRKADALQFLLELTEGDDEPGSGSNGVVKKETDDVVKSVEVAIATPKKPARKIEETAPPQKPDRIANLNTAPISQILKALEYVLYAGEGGAKDIGGPVISVGFRDLRTYGLLKSREAAMRAAPNQDMTYEDFLKQAGGETKIAPVQGESGSLDDAVDDGEAEDDDDEEDPDDNVEALLAKIVGKDDDAPKKQEKRPPLGKDGLPKFVQDQVEALFVDELEPLKAAAVKNKIGEEAYGIVARIAAIFLEYARGKGNKELKQRAGIDSAFITAAIKNKMESLLSAEEKKALTELIKRIENMNKVEYRNFKIEHVRREITAAIRLVRKSNRGVEEFKKTYRLQYQNIKDILKAYETYPTAELVPDLLTWDGAVEDDVDAVAASDAGEDLEE
ncbi:MAG: hypothetical protein HOO67_05190 [Candidatus Peribacteraceae bacterium]|nr:hypothetical protein [Candidatus Peribacteraceae bacterium]